MSQQLLPPPEPGIYPGVEMETYLAWDAISNSRLSKAARSLAHYRANVGMDESPSLRFGTLCHCGALEPLAIMERYAVMPAFERDPENCTAKGDRSDSKQTSYYKRRAAEWEAQHADRIRVGADEYDAMVGLVTALARHPIASEYLNHGSIETCLIWDDPDTGLRCKARLDRWDRRGQRFADLKTTRDALRFDAAIVNFSYHRQAAHYRAGIEILTGEIHRPHIVAVETTAPFGVRAAPLAESLLEQAAEEREDLLRRIKAAIVSGDWPGYDSPEEWTGPAWSQRFDDADTESIGDWVRTNGSTIGV